MNTEPTFEITFTASNQKLGTKEVKEIADDLAIQLNNLDGAKNVKRIEREFQQRGLLEVIQVITAAIKARSFKPFIDYIADLFEGKPISLKIKFPDGKEISIEAPTRAAFELVMNRAERFL